MFVKLTTSRLPIQHTDGLAQYPVLSRSPPSYRRAAGGRSGCAHPPVDTRYGRDDVRSAWHRARSNASECHQRVMVIDVSDTRDQLQAFINPELTETSAQTKPGEEGCLSVPGIYDTVER